MSLSDFLVDLKQDERITIRADRDMEAIVVDVTKGPPRCLCFSGCTCTLHTERYFLRNALRQGKFDIAGFELARILELMRKHHADQSRPLA